MPKLAKHLDMVYQRIDKMDRVYIDKDLAEKEVLIEVIDPAPEDRTNYIKVGRSS